MGKRSAEFEARLAESPAFAPPIIKKVRRLLHAVCPHIEEHVKWGHFSFEYKGIVGGVAVFKQHAAFRFWKAQLLSDPHGLLRAEDHGLGRLTDVSQLPADDILLGYIHEAVELNEKGVKLPPKKKPARPKLKAPDYFMAALRKNKKVLAAFEAFSPSHQREYIEWLAEAKQPATRDKRLATALEWIAEGKPRNWKYMKR